MRQRNAEIPLHYKLLGHYRYVWIYPDRIVILFRSTARGDFQRITEQKARFITKVQYTVHMDTSDRIPLAELTIYSEVLKTKQSLLNFFS